MKSVIKHLALFIASVFFSLTAIAADSATASQNGEASYTIKILSPSEGTTFQNETTTIPVTFTMSPSLKVGHKVKILVDGQIDRNTQMTGKANPNKMTLLISKLERGSHTIQIEIVDQNGQKISTSPLTTIQQQRPSKLLAPK